ncbi:hypothetical protein PZB74_19030 [Porifericola rhodea]|uniref:hypothetical protein n=1 Tax=Porifericola rhodea TaxID=930972 RepID=UPI002667000F|nr:hypothetical protein [Porifericola rhodea]WKN31047.1 hypothetical protein PZB74_19030 [Porifericola rhodea]
MNQIRQVKTIRWAVVLFYIATIVVNYISQTLPFNGQTNGEVSDKYSTLFTPADYAFSIWGLIYLSLGIYVFYQAFWASPSQKVYDNIGKWAIVSFVTTSLWLPAFQYEQIALSNLIMVTILASLIQIVAILQKSDEIKPSIKMWVKVPFGLYLGWISIATIVNLAVLFKYSDLPLLGLSESMWVSVMLAIGLVLASVVSSKSRNLVYALVFVWGYVAIAFKEGQSQEVFTYAAIAAALLILSITAISYRLYKSR